MTTSDRRNRWGGRFDRTDEDADPMASMASLVDVMLVFACGLMAALMAQVATSQVNTDGPQNKNTGGGHDIKRSKPLPTLPTGLGKAGSGYRPVGRVFRDPDTGKLILIESSP